MVKNNKVSIIVAAAKNGVIGREGDLPWRLSADLRRFKRITMGHPIVMGRKTWDSIGRPLPGRSSVVVTRKEGFRTEFEDVHVVHSLEEAIEVASGLPGGEESFLIGGAQLYEAALPMADRLYFTYVEAEVEGDAWFPEFDWGRWKQVETEKVPADEKNDHSHTFSIYHRI